MDYLNNLTDERLEEIICRAENTHADGSQYLKAKNILEVRRNKKLFEHQNNVIQLQAKAFQVQEEFFQTAKTKLDQIIKILDKPGWAIFYAGVGAVIIGVAINLISDFYHLLPIFHSANNTVPNLH